MNFINRKNLGLFLIVIPMLLLMTSAFSKFFGSTSSIEMFEKWGMLEHMRWISISEFIISTLVLFPKTSKIGIFLLGIYMGGAMSIHLTHMEGNLILVPLFILVSSVLGYLIKDNFEFFKKLFS